MRKGYLALVLHATYHSYGIQISRISGRRLVFEGITETYIPLWQVFEGLLRDGVPFRLTMSLTPTLCAMLDDVLLRERYLRYRDGRSRYRTGDRSHALQPEINHLAGSIIAVFSNAAIYADRLKCDPSERLDDSRTTVFWRSSPAQPPMDFCR